MGLHELEPSQYLTWKELACKDGTPYPFEFKRDGRVYKLAAVFENIRILCGDKPIKIHSAYRTPAYNHSIGGVAHSQHIEGRALDLGVPKGLTIDEFYKLILSKAFGWGIRGIGKYNTFVHIDTRPGNKLVLWDFSNAKSESTSSK